MNDPTEKVVPIRRGLVTTKARMLHIDDARELIRALHAAGIGINGYPVPKKLRFKTIPANGRKVTIQMVRDLMDDEGI